MTSNISENRILLTLPLSPMLSHSLDLSLPPSPSLSLTPSLLLPSSASLFIYYSFMDTLSLYLYLSLSPSIHIFIPLTPSFYLSIQSYFSTCTIIHTLALSSTIVFKHRSLLNHDDKSSNHNQDLLVHTMNWVNPHISHII